MITILENRLGALSRPGQPAPRLQSLSPLEQITEFFVEAAVALVTALRARHEYEYCDVCVNRSDDNMLDVCLQVSQQLTSDPTTTPQQCHKEIDNAANRADQ